MTLLPKKIQVLLFILFFLLATGCGHHENVFVNEEMDFGAIQSVAVMPFVNLTRDTQAADRVRDVFITMLLSTGGLYVIPTGEVAKGIVGANIASSFTPTPEEVVKFCKLTKVEAVITGVIREYGEIKSGTTVANVISVSMQMMEGQTGTVVWAADSTKGGIGFKDRLLGGGGEPLNVVTEKALDEIIQKLFE